MLNLMNLRDHRRVAVTGIAGGGKTVFLTSLLSHLAEFGQGGFHVGKGIEISDFQRCPLKNDWPPEFNHAGYREELAREHWPEKSTDCSQFTCRFRRSDWKLYSQKMTFFDFPGERVADAAIAAFSSYDEWSDHILKHFADHHGYARAAGPYLNYLTQANITHKEVVSRYKEALARMILDYKPLISPSTFLLDQKGCPASPGTEKEISASRYAGISFAEEFAPLSNKARANHPDVAKQMFRTYQNYRKKLVMPLFDRISKANSIIVLVDIPSLLSGGVGRYNDNRRILLDLCELLRPKSDIGALLSKYFSFLYESLSRIAFVAAKADMVHPLDIDNKRMENLLKMMTHRAAGMLPDVKCKWFVCSACHSTFPVQGERRLNGKIIYNNPEKNFMEYSVPLLPETWPENWSAGDYPFYKVYPDAPKNYLLPPRHIGLDRIFEFISE
ncbi:YcjX family protein [Desulfonatronovibrio magnus]|uniref:YcjX family protein n=1 Tax=Desulfonatronovibrio magnus TaxID=698827 RepID=UPI000A035973|nr:YcjX family protein [Desulfonatronovibrio magnus]